MRNSTNSSGVRRRGQTPRRRYALPVVGIIPASDRCTPDRAVVRAACMDEQLGVEHERVLPAGRIAVCDHRSRPEREAIPASVVRGVARALGPQSLVARVARVQQVECDLVARRAVRAHASKVNVETSARKALRRDPRPRAPTRACSQPRSSIAALVRRRALQPRAAWLSIAMRGRTAV
jgi:hypothetical protein